MRRRVVGSRVPAVVLAGLLVLGACGGACGGGDEGGDDAAERTTTTDASATSTAATRTPSTSAPSTSAPGPPDSATAPDTSAPDISAPVEPGGTGDPLPDGSNFGYVTAVSSGDRTITIDVAELLTGDAAVIAAIEDGVLEPGAIGVDNDYYVRNRNPKLRTVPVAPDAVVVVLVTPGSPDIVAGDLGAIEDQLPTYRQVGGAGVPVRVTASGGVVTRIDQVFFP